MSPEQIIRRPIVLTEKASLLRQHNTVVFEVARTANKIQIRQAVEALFGVTVRGVHTLVMRGKDRRMGRTVAKMQNWKKAMVKLADGQNIDFFDDSAGSAS